MPPRVWLPAALLLSAAPCLAQLPSQADSAAGAPGTPPMAALAAPPTGPDFPRGKISGLAFGDVYWNASGDPRHAYAVATGLDSGKVNIDGSGRPITRDLNGVQIRRIYFQLDNDLSIRYATRLRLEVDGRSLTGDGKLTVFVKNAYLQAKSVWPRGDVYVGMLNTPAWEMAEEFWQYRAVEKTVGDFLGYAPASDLGLRASGFLDPDHHLGYSAMVGDGTGQRPETNRDKRVYLALPVVAGNVRLEPYADYENAPGARDRATYRAFAGFEPGHAALGLEAWDRVLHAPTRNVELRALSVFGRWTASPSLAAFARWDVSDTVRVTGRVREHLLIGGIDWQPFKDVHVIPNVEATQYAARGSATAPPWHDLQARVTFYYRFAKPQS
jgi:hypothetical protein